MRTYSELIQTSDYLERYYYLRIGAKIGVQSFGHNRYLNQMLYGLPEWKEARRKVILRDGSCDLGIPGFEIERPNILIVHHMNPVTVEDILQGNPDVFEPEFLITCSDRTHKAIHYGDESLLITEPITRSPGDTRLWGR